MWASCWSRTRTFVNAERRANLDNTLRSLLDRKNIVPVINENDSVATEELKFGDNDALSASVAVLARASLLILLTSVDGLHAAGRNAAHRGARDRHQEVMDFARDEKGEYSVGGMASKLKAVEQAVSAGIETIIANGRRPEQIPELVAGHGIATRFAAGAAGLTADGDRQLPLAARGPARIPCRHDESHCAGRSC